MFLKDHHKTALIWQDRAITYKDLLLKAGQFSARIQKTKSTRVAIISENRPEFVYTLYGAWAAGAVPVIFDFNAEKEQTLYILNESRPEIIFVSGQYKSRLDGFLSHLQFTPKIIVLDDQLRPGNASMPGKIDPPDKQDTALILYTSGTTANPKGVMLSFQNLLANINSIIDDGLSATTADAGLVLLPLFHGFPLLWTLILPLSVGATCVMLSSLEPKIIMDTLKRYPVTVIVAVPKFFELIRNRIMSEINSSFVRRGFFKLARSIDSITVSKFIFSAVHKKIGSGLRYFICGGAAIDPQIEHDFKTLGFELQTGYGMTETGPMITFNRPGNSTIGSVGQAIRYTEVKITDGEIAVRGDNLMKGYFNPVNASNGHLKDGWFFTGDLGRIDNNGFIFIEGRKNEMIVLPNGKNINPLTIEAVLKEHPDLIADVAVVKANSVLKAIIYPGEAHSVPGIYEAIAEQVIDPYNQSVPAHKKIAAFHLSAEELPKTLLGKIKRHKLSLNDNKTGPAATNGRYKSRPELELLIQYLQAEKNITVTPAERLLSQAGLDSLDIVMFISFIESSFGITIDDNILTQNPTLAGLSEYIADHKERAFFKKTDWHDVLQDNPRTAIPQTWITLRILQYKLRLLFSMFCKLKIEGLNTLPDGPLIFAANQQSSLDEFFISAFLSPGEFGRTYYLAKIKHFRQRWKRFIANRHNTILVDANHNLKAALHQLAAVIRKNRNILIFPEGTRSLNGELAPFKKTYAILSCELNIPVIPVVIEGSLDVLPRGKIMPRPFKKVTVRFLDTVYPDGHSHDSMNEKIFCTINEERLLLASQNSADS